MKFEDHFSPQASDYANYRPDYPDSLFRYLSSLTHEKKMVWDCATGSGQAAVKLASYFDRVMATDASEAQIRQAFPHERVSYEVGLAENTSFPDASFDLITVAQAAHWFDMEAFLREAARVGKEGAILAVWTYSLLSIEPGVDAVIRSFYHHKVGKYWPPQRKIVESEYRDLVFPDHELETPAFSMEKRWSLDHLIGYLHTWSAVKNFVQKEGYNPVTDVVGDLTSVWGNDPLKTVTWKIPLRVVRLNV